MIFKLGMKHQGEEPEMTLTYFMDAFEWGKVGRCHLIAEKLLGMSKWTEYFCL